MLNVHNWYYFLRYLYRIIVTSIYMGADSKILRVIKIGNNIVIGANALVITDIPEGSLVVGVPAKIVKHGIRMQDYV
jgi:serine O-acetyltransferase